MTPTLTWSQARRIALRAQGMGPARRAAVPGLRASREALERTVERTHLLQIDSVSVFARAHHMPVFTRTGSWDIRALDQLSRPGPQRGLREALAHEAAFATPEVHRLLRFRREQAARRDWAEVRRAAQQTPDLFERIVTTIAEHGPLSAAAISRRLGDVERGEGWGWRRTASQWAVEYLFRSGSLDCVGRNAQFERLYVVDDEEATEQPAAADWASLEDGNGHEAGSVRALAALAARALGVADPAAIADYFRLGIGRIRPALRDLIESGELTEVEVRHPRARVPMLLHRDAPEPAPLRSAALISPFDPIVFHRPRLARLFDVDYRIGIYTPAARRTTGYYSLLFLLGDRIPARVDLKADRARGVLEVRGAYREQLPLLGNRRRPGEETITHALSQELRRAARWQGLEAVEVRTGAGTGELAAALHARMREGEAAPSGDADPAAVPLGPEQARGAAP